MSSRPSSGSQHRRTHGLSVSHPAGSWSGRRTATAAWTSGPRFGPYPASSMPTTQGIPNPSPPAPLPQGERGESSWGNHYRNRRRPRQPAEDAPMAMMTDNLFQNILHKQIPANIPHD